MIHAVFESDSGTLCTVSVKGHAEFADAGQDIVCAAVSSAVQLTANLITDTFQEKAEILAEENHIKISLKEPEKGNASRLLEGLLTHFSFIEEDYPGTMKIKLTDYGGGKNA